MIFTPDREIVVYETTGGALSILGIIISIIGYLFSGILFSIGMILIITGVIRQLIAHRNMAIDSGRYPDDFL